MSIDEGFALLASPRSSDRLKGARLLAKSKDFSKLPELRQYERQEADSWVRHTLARVIGKWQASTAIPDSDESWISPKAESELEDIRSQAIQNVTQTLLHEMHPLLADISAAVAAEISLPFAGSRSAAALARTTEFLQVIHRLYEASASANNEEFDLSSLILEVIHYCGYTEEQVLATRLDPVITVGDPGLLRIALQNVIKNAVEASEKTEVKVLVNCAVTDSYSWVVVLDEGVGFPEGHERAWEPGITSKSKETHFGWGLPITKRAVASLGGTIKLVPREHRGISCEIRWPLVEIVGKETT
ncbi:sensor histidine kinase [Arthrobacter sp. SLBN-122]|uniref:sensor histidine kinase n=1 Tax=Arthrobacter sp. SLBN-122 TaxID=2768455 RepID=UPI00114F6889|nr:HAMP domain-containing sensor histidine kinase [Arthrobacter sp. SLBN-122]